MSLAIGTIYPAWIQQFKVGPNEFATEKPYIARNINSTRKAFGLDQVEPTPYDFTSFNDVSSPEEVVGEQNAGTVDNARLWDPAVIQETYSQLQDLQTYYQIGDVDVDRYLVDNEQRQVLIAARNLNSADLPSQSFVNRHIVYTHGYGVVASPSNAVEPGGTPDYYLSDMPVHDGRQRDPDGLGPGVGDLLRRGAHELRAHRRRAEGVQLPGARAAPTGSPGTRAPTASPLSNWLRRAAFALRFGSIDPLISGQVTSSTKLLMERDIRARVEKLAPFLSFDADPYPVVLGNKTLWVMDGYTSSDMYPYSQEVTGEGGLAHGMNYVRNSVKVTVDAYQGTVEFYVFDEKDPIIRAWRKAFPDLFTDKSQMQRRAQGAPAVPRGPLQGADRPVRPLPRDGAEAVLQRQRQVAGVARSRHVGGERSRASGMTVGAGVATSRRRPRRPASASTRTT